MVFVNVFGLVVVTGRE